MIVAKFRKHVSTGAKADGSPAPLSQNQLSEEDRIKLKEVAAVDGLYRIRVPRFSCRQDRQERCAAGVPPERRHRSHLTPLGTFIGRFPGSDDTPGLQRH
ncbi:ER membrane protein complex subunit 10 isoform X1 [Lates japonicus]|uniref:ER membrane protein complex subunit 10 isoform X1 n=1 Tax=Lates japonicus TaxID=270547 RepID=A0AAD3M7K3_LATJO|nr:ER membrane protein complex subunit 10 isoform X1 [Lates japonicus]